jgi:flagellin
MTEVAFASASTITDTYPRAGSAAELVQAIRDARSSQPIAVEATGLAIANDHIGLARSGRFGAEAQAALSASGSAAHAGSLLAAADDALAEIVDKLESLADLAEDASADGLSSLDYARIDTSFQQIKSEIDSLAESASFSGTTLLNGDGTGGPLTIEYSVGTGAAASDRIEIEIGAASVSDLSAALDTGDVLSAASAASAAIAVAEAEDAAGAIRARVSGDRTRVGTAYLANLDSGGANESVRAALADPTLALDLARVVAGQVAEEGELPLTAGAEHDLRNLLVRLETVSAPSSSSDTGTRRPTVEPERVPQPLTAEPAASRQGNGQE